MASPAPQAGSLASVDTRPFDGVSNSFGTHLLSPNDQYQNNLQADDHRSYTLHQDEIESVHFENISADEDAQQIIVSTTGKRVYGKDIAVKAKGNQILGQIAEPALQQLTQDHANLLLRMNEGEESKENASFNQVYKAGRVSHRK